MTTHWRKKCVLYVYRFLYLYLYNTYYQRTVCACVILVSFVFFVNKFLFFVIAVAVVFGASVKHHCESRYLSTYTMISLYRVLPFPRLNNGKTTNKVEWRPLYLKANAYNIAHTHTHYYILFAALLIALSVFQFGCLFWMDKPTFIWCLRQSNMRVLNL